MGLGPTPQDVGTPGLKCYKPTRLQMEIIAPTEVESEKDALEEHVLQLQAQIEQRVQQDRASEEPLSHHGSTTLHACLYIPIFPSPCAISWNCETFVSHFFHVLVQTTKVTFVCCSM
jgi:hypothetical protein